MAFTPNLMDEVDRLFDELVYFPWRRATTRPVAPKPGKLGDGWKVEVPLRPGEQGDVDVGVDGDRLTITVRRHSAEHRHQDNVATTTAGHESFQQTFALPAGSQLRGVEVSFSSGLVRVHVRIDPA